jgi:predicted flap endonuclease-1-like 5' DNA nuclease
MNETSAATSAPGSSLLPDGTGVITTIHLVLIVLIALAAVAVIVIGARRKRARRQAEIQVERNAEQAGIEPAAPAPVAGEEVSVTPPPPPPPPSPAVEQVQTQSQTSAQPVATEPMPVVTPPADRLPAADPLAVDSRPVDPQPVGPRPAKPTSLSDEPIPAAAPLDASPATLAGDLPGPDLVKRDAATPVSADAPVTTLKGLGPKVAARLSELGVTTVGQIAALTDAEAEALDAELGAFRGRMSRDRWIEQARLLSAGDRAGFEAAFGRL